MNKIKKIHFGIVGLGNIASTHARAIRGHEDADVSAAASRSEKNRLQFKKEFDLPLFETYEDLLSFDPIDAITVCTPTGTHLEYGERAAEAGKHVIIEKPIEITVQRGRRLIDCCRQNGVKLAVIYQNRFSKGAIRVKEVIESGIIGTPIMARAAVKWFRDQEYYSSSNWRGTLRLDGGGAVINQAVHTIDLLYWFLGEAEAVSAFKGTMTHPDIEAEDNAVAIVRFKSGVLAVFEASTSIIPPQPRRIEINGTKGSVVLTDDEAIVMLGSGSEIFDSESDSVFDEDESQKRGSGAADPMEGLGVQNHTAQYKQIIHAIRNDEAPVVSGEESLQSLAVVESIYRSSELRTEVVVKDLILGNKI